MSNIPRTNTAATTKPWYASKTVWGSIVGVGALIAGFFGVHTDPATQAMTVNGITAASVGIAGVVSTGLTLVGRLTATKPIG